MRILHVSDLHGNLGWYQWLIRESKSYDVTCVSGDLISAGDSEQKQIAEVTAALSLIHTPLAVCSGNHDMVHSKTRGGGALWVCDLKREGVWVDGDRFQLKGHNFYCHAWCEPIPAARTDEIWLIHAAPSGTPTASCEYLNDMGDFEFAQVCAARKGPQIALCGHAHRPAAWYAQFRGTTIFNPGFAENSSVPAHIVIDLDQRIATRSLPGRPSESVLFSAIIARALLIGCSREQLEKILGHAVRNMEAEGYQLTVEEIEIVRRKLREMSSGNE